MVKRDLGCIKSDVLNKYPPSLGFWERWAAKKCKMGGQKKAPTLKKTEKVGILKEEKSGRKVGILRKTHFFSKNVHAHTQKNEYGKKITYFLKVSVKKKKWAKSGRAPTF